MDLHPNISEKPMLMPLPVVAHLGQPQVLGIAELQSFENNGRP
jgi:hypothetical protein